GGEGDDLEVVAGFGGGDGRLFVASLQGDEVRAFACCDAVGFVEGTAVGVSFDQQDAQEDSFILNTCDKHVCADVRGVCVAVPSGAVLVLELLDGRVVEVDRGQGV